MDLVPSTGTLAHSSANDDSISSMIQKKKAEDSLEKRMEELKLQKAIESENEKLEKENLEVKDENERLKKEIQELKLKEQKTAAESELKKLLKLNLGLEDSLEFVALSVEYFVMFAEHMPFLEDTTYKFASVSSNFKKMLMALKGQKSYVEEDLKKNEKLAKMSQDLKHEDHKINPVTELEKLMKEKSVLENCLEFAASYFESGTEMGDPILIEIYKFGNEKLVMALKNQISYMEEKFGSSVFI